MEENFHKELDGNVVEQPLPPIEPPQPQIVERIYYKESHKPVWGFWAVIIFLSITLAGTLYWGYTNEQKASFYEDLLGTVTVDSAAVATDNFDAALYEGYDFAVKYPIYVSNVEIANVEKDLTIINDFGSDIYSSDTKYLQPKITYYSVEERTIDIYTKWYCEDGSIVTGDNSPDGYSQRNELSISPGECTYELPGWGGENSGHWAAGKYRLEIWIDNDVCVKYYTFTIY